MEVVRYAPSLEVEEDLNLEYGKTYVVEAINFSDQAGVLLALVGFTYGNKHKEHYQFPANHFRTPNGMRAELVKARTGTKAFDQYGNALLYLVGFALLEGEEKVWCQKCGSTDRPALRPLPYDMFEHV